MMKMESFFIGPADEDTMVPLNLSMKDIKFIHATLVECYDAQPSGNPSNALTDAILLLETRIRETLVENEKT